MYTAVQLYNTAAVPVQHSKAGATGRWADARALLPAAPAARLSIVQCPERPGSRLVNSTLRQALGGGRLGPKRLGCYMFLWNPKILCPGLLSRLKCL
eukprot:COSAG05_NODE_1612_length_4407_cov_43.627205_2_plen_97_part_00